ncbi:MAG: DUF523 domain-containing protein [Candidatus Omnitrophota bacterium]
MILVSACLAGIKCAWDGKGREKENIKALVAQGKAIPVCPEVLAGRAIPRERTEIEDGDGEGVIKGAKKVYEETGKDVTGEFLKGAYLTLDIIKTYKIKEAILKSKSPSCGVGRVYDGSFKGGLVKGDGVTTALLKKEGVLCRDI